jgi:hypothetical protein
VAGKFRHSAMELVRFLFIYFICFASVFIVEVVDLNLGCPQEYARARHIGGYLLSRKDWPIVESLGM